MNVIKTAFVITLVVLAATVAVGLLLPSEIEVTRSVDIDATAPVVFALIEDLKRWPEWTVWRKESGIEPHFGLLHSGKGASMIWSLPKGRQGSLTVVAVNSPQELTYQLSIRGMDLDAGADDERQVKFVTRGRFWFESPAELERGIRVSWHEKGDAGFFGAFFRSRIERELGQDMQTSLDGLKALAEG